MNKKVLTFLQVFLTIALVVFIITKAGDFLKNVEWQDVVIHWPYIVIAGLFFFSGYILLAFHWLYACRMIDEKTNQSQWLAYLASQPYKYLPTSLFTFSFRAKFAADLGMSLRHSTQAQVIENTNLIGAGFGIGVLALLLTYDPILFTSAIIILAALVFMIWRKDSITVPKVKHKIDLHKWLVSVVIVGMGWLGLGIGFYMMALGLEGSYEPINSVAANSVATSSGILAVFAPGGIGVREVVFHYFGFASATIVVWRFVTFIIDIILGIWSALLIRRSRQ